MSSEQLSKSSDKTPEIKVKKPVKKIDGKKYDRALLKTAKKASKDGLPSHVAWEHIQRAAEVPLTSPKIVKRTLKYIQKKYNFNPDGEYPASPPAKLEDKVIVQPIDYSDTAHPYQKGTNRRHLGLGILAGIILAALALILYLTMKGGGCNYPVTENPRAKIESVKASTAKTPNVKYSGVTIYYQFDETQIDLSEDIQSRLQRLVSAVKSEAGGKIEVVGHTCDLGDPEANSAISLQRAVNIGYLLQSYGVDASKIIARGEGSARPVVPNSTEDNRRKNRRVSVRVIIEK